MLGLFYTHFRSLFDTCEHPAGQPQIAAAAQGLRVDGSVLLLMTDDAWAELGLASGTKKKVKK